MNPARSFVCLLILHALPVPAVADGPSAVRDRALALLAVGRQIDAEDLVARSQGLFRWPDHRLAFLDGAMHTSRFDERGARRGLVLTMLRGGDSPEARTAACVLAIENAESLDSVLVYYSALLDLGRRHPENIPVRWMGGVMSRKITYQWGRRMSKERKLRIAHRGITEMQAVLDLMAPGIGPSLVHQALGNLFHDTYAHVAEWRHREILLSLEDKQWGFESAARTLWHLDRQRECIALCDRGLAAHPNASRLLERKGLALERLGRLPDAALTLIEAAETATSPRRKASKLTRAAGVLERMGHHTLAHKMSARALALTPRDAWRRYHERRHAVLAGVPGSSERFAALGRIVTFDGKLVDHDFPEDPWFRAAATGDLPTIHALLPQVDVNRRNADSHGKTALMSAAQRGWTHIIPVLIEAGADLNRVDGNKDTALHYAAQFEQGRALRQLVKAGANPNLQDVWGQTPLFMAATEGDSVSSMRLLLDHGADPDILKPTGGTALHQAAHYGHRAKVLLLIEAGADVNARVPRGGETVLMRHTSGWGRDHLVDTLVSSGADPNARRDNGDTFLHTAVNPILNRVLIDAILAAGADPLVEDANGLTAITRARLQGHDAAARSMERAAGREEDFTFPDLPAADGDFTTVPGRARAFALPLLLTQGDPFRDPATLPEADAKFQLRNFLGITSRSQINGRLHNPRLFLAGFHGKPHNIPAVTGIPPVDAPLQDAAASIVSQIVAESGAADDTAWVLAHQIHLALLGTAGGLLGEPEAGRHLLNADSAIRAAFDSWEDYLSSFLLGATLHAGWDAERYHQACERLLKARPPWPGKGAASGR